MKRLIKVVSVDLTGIGPKREVDTVRYSPEPLSWLVTSARSDNPEMRIPSMVDRRNGGWNASEISIFHWSTVQ